MSKPIKLRKAHLRGLKIREVSAEHSEDTNMARFEQYDRIHNKLDKLDEKMETIRDIMVKQQLILDEHVRRCDLLEAQMKPIQEAQIQLKGLAKLGAILATLASITAGIYELYKK